MVSLLTALLVAVVTFVILDRLTPSDIILQPASPPDIVIEITGAIATPGVYELPGSSRLQRAIDRAGGLRAEADVSSLNLAGRIGDGEKLVIPSRANTGPIAEPVASPQGSDPGNESSLIDLNTATAAELDTLPGIGPVIAERILSYRDVNGPFTSVDRLADVEGISAAMVEEIRPLVTVDD